MKKVVTIMLALSLGVMFTNTLMAQGYDNPLTKDIDEGAIGTGYDNPLTKDIDEGAIGTGYDNPLTKDIDEGNWWDPDN